MRPAFLLTCALAALLPTASMARASKKPRHGVSATLSKSQKLRHGVRPSLSPGQKLRRRVRPALAQVQPPSASAPPSAPSLSPAAREAVRLADEGCASDGFEQDACDKAITQLQQVSRAEPNNTDVQLALARAYWNSSYFAPETGPTRNDLRQRSTGILQRLVDRGSPDARPYWELSLRQKDEAKRVPLLRRTVELNPSHPQAHEHLAEALMAEGQPDEAARQFQQHLAVSPPKEREDTQRSLQFARKLAPQRPEAAAAVVDQTWQATKDESRTERCLRFQKVEPGLTARRPALKEAVKQVQPYCTHTEHLDRAADLEREGRTDEALDELQKQEDANPKPEETRVLMERLYLRKGRPDLAAQAAQRLLADEPDAKQKCERFRQLAPTTVRALPPGTVDTLSRDCGQP